MIETEVLTEELVCTEETKVHDLIVFNDDYNTFEYVIDTLVDVCKHTSHQAEQCTMIIHYKGKCTVKRGDFEEMASMRNSICERGISAEVL